MKIIVLGAGLIGGPMVRDLVNDPDLIITVVDRQTANLDKLGADFKGIRITSDLADKGNLQKLIQDQDIVLSAVPGYLGYETLKTVIEAGKNIVDIAFSPEDIFTLDERARSMGVIAVVDMGVAPGMSNLLTGYADSMLDKTEKVTIYVGGLPRIRQWPWEYKAVFSPVDVIEEYTRPARFVDRGQMVIKPALSDPELLDFPGIGTLEAFNSDGLRTLMATIQAPTMIEKTLRYAGHIEKIRVLRDAGFFSTDPIEIHGASIRPLDLTTRLLFPKWKLNEGEEDITIMQVIVEGIKDHEPVRFIWDLYDTYDPVSGVHSMARTTGYTATMAVRMIAHRLYREKGISPPEFIGKNHLCVEFILEGLRERGVVYEMREERGERREEN
ncbi:MAG: saccharopine dehydrogenase C-terminal domain-containing protein [Bacteroidales bacterium]|nr:saccharopine dehydrogenase NADP-binding domain-containing protein [Lentimicrobiaceae bacterium]MDD5694363.1 saccharopine dehydrogenase C-terminal domain-containing protein [Bacteroidales bacterium]